MKRIRGLILGAIGERRKRMNNCTLVEKLIFCACLENFWEESPGTGERWQEIAVTDIPSYFQYAALRAE